MRILLMSQDGPLVERLTKQYDALLDVSASWPDAMPEAVLVVDCRCLSATAWSRLIAYSRLLDRVAIVACGVGVRDGDRLARLAADGYVGDVGDFDGVVDAIEQHLHDSKYRAVGAAFARSIGAREPLARWIVTIFDAFPPFRTCEAAARAAGVPIRTLRHQLHECGGSATTLKGLNALVRELRKLPPSAVCERMTSIDRLVETWSPPDCDRLTFRKQLSDILAPLADLRPLAGTAPAEDPDGGSARAKRTSAPQTGTRIRNCC